MTHAERLELKKKEVDKFSQLIDKYPVIGLLSINKVPSGYIQNFRHETTNEVEIRVSKKTIISRALAKSKKKGVEKLFDLPGDQVGLIFSNKDSFLLKKLIEDKKISTKAKSRDISAMDIVIPAGETDFRPGPILTEFQKAGIPARIERGKIVVLKDTLLVSKGKPIDEQKASVLSELGLEPIRLGFSLLGTYDGGIVISESELTIDEEGLIQNIVKAHLDALKLSLSVVYPTTQSIRILLNKAHSSAFNLSINAKIPTKDNIKHLVALAFIKTASLREALSQKNQDLRSYYAT